MRSNPNRFLHATLCFENLSSGENLAGCADNVGFPSGPVFCSLSRGKRKRAAGGEFRDDEFSIEIKMLFRCVFQQREKKRRDKTELLRRILTERTMFWYIKFSYLERVHALPVLVQVVHEIHDDDDVKKNRISAEQSLCENCVPKKWAVCQMRHMFFIFLFVCCVRNQCVLLSCTKCLRRRLRE